MVGVGVIVGLGVIVGVIVGVRVGVEVGNGVLVIDGVKDGANDFPTPHADVIKVIMMIETKKEQCFIFSS